MATSNATIFEYLDALRRSREGDPEALAAYTAPITPPAPRKPFTVTPPKPPAPKLQPGLL